MWLLRSVLSQFLKHNKNMRSTLLGLILLIRALTLSLRCSPLVLKDTKGLFVWRENGDNKGGEEKSGRKIWIFLHLVHKRKLRRKWEVWVLSTRTYQKLFSPNWRENKGENVGVWTKLVFHPFSNVISSTHFNHQVLFSSFLQTIL